MAAQACKAPIAFLGLTHGDRLRLEAEIGLGVRQLAVGSLIAPGPSGPTGLLLVPDTAEDPRLAGHELFAGPWRARFLAAAPLTDPEGRTLGLLAIADREPRTLDPDQRFFLEALARNAASQIELSRALADRDRTEQRRAQDALERSQQRVAAALDTGLIGFFEWDLLDGLVIGDEHFARFHDLDPEICARGVPLEKLVARMHPDDHAKHVENVHQAVARGADYGVSFRVLHKDGTLCWLMVRARCTFRRDGKSIRYSGISIDVTTAKIAEGRLRLLSEAAGGLLAADDPAIVLAPILQAAAPEIGFDQSYSYVLSEDGKRLELVSGFNISDEARTAYRSMDVGDPLCGIVAQTRRPLLLEDIPSHTASSAPTKTAGMSAFAGFPVIAGNRLYGVISFLSSKRKAFTEEHISFFATLADYVAIVYNRVRAERELHELNNSLEAKVELRTRELRLAEESLRHSQKMEAIGQLTGGIAHDFNNLLTVIRGSADLLRRTDLSEERRSQYVDAIADTADRASKLTTQLLAFARRQPLKPEVFDVAGTARAVSEMLSTLVGGRIQIETRIDCESCTVEADPSQFETALVNLAVNARDAMEDGGTLTLSIGLADSIPPIRGHTGAHGSFVVVSVSDTGCGIPPERIARIFEPFYTTKPVGKGTGLGLSQVFGFVKQSGGNIDVKSEVGSGTTFTFYLPQVNAPASSRSNREEPVEPAGLARGHVLLVEDNADVGAFAKQLLEDLGYTATHAESGAEALDLLRDGASRFDIIFSDVVMPGMSGIELAHHVRREWPQLPVVLTSGYSHILADQGSYGFTLLQKPYTVGDLKRILTGVATTRGAATAA